MLTHHTLKVYEKALAVAADARELSAGWGRRHAIVEHFRRASESVVLNFDKISDEVFDKAVGREPGVVKKMSKLRPPTRIGAWGLAILCELRSHLPFAPFLLLSPQPNL
jgi:hypothetical protein